MIINAQSTKKENGVGFIVEQASTRVVMGYDSLSNRVMALRLASTLMNVTIIQCYAPTSQYGNDVVETFYDKICGDFNAKVGCEETEVTRTHGIGDRNERGKQLIDFCKEMNLVVSNTPFQQHPRRLYTRTSPDGRTKNQTDYILMQKQWRSSIKNVKTKPGAEADTDHNLLCVNVKWKVRKISKYKQQRKWNTQALRCAKIQQAYAVKISNRFDILMEKYMDDRNCCSKQQQQSMK